MTFKGVMAFILCHFTHCGANYIKLTETRPTVPAPATKYSRKIPVLGHISPMIVNARFFHNFSRKLATPIRFVQHGAAILATAELWLLQTFGPITRVTVTSAPR